MEEEKKLYPFNIIPIEDEVGGTLLLADLGDPDSQIRNGWLATNTMSEIMDMYMDRVSGENVFPYYGRQFPVMLKRLNGNARTPLTVCPDDVLAAERFDFLGKAKLWYVEKAEPGSKLFIGLKRRVSAEEFYLSCQDGSVEKLLNVITPRPGDSYYIAPGVLHSAGAGVTVLEVAESSPLDFSVFDWGDKDASQDEFDASLSLEAAFDFIDFGPFRSETSGICEGNVKHLCSHTEFSVSEISLDAPLHISGGQFESFTLYLGLKGSASIQVPLDMDSPALNKCERYRLVTGEAVVVPAEITDFYMVPEAQGTSVIEVIVEARHDVDSYTGDVETEAVADDEDEEKASPFNFFN